MKLLYRLTSDVEISYEPDTDDSVEYREPTWSPVLKALRARTGVKQAQILPVTDNPGSYTLNIDVNARAWLGEETWQQGRQFLIDEGSPIDAINILDGAMDDGFAHHITEVINGSFRGSGQDPWSVWEVQYPEITEVP